MVIAGADATVVPPGQPADIYASGDGTGGMAVANRAMIPSDQPTHTFEPSYIHTNKADFPDDARSAGFL